MNDILEQRGHDAHELHKQIVQLCWNANRLFLDLGKAFAYVHDNKIYLDMGFDNFTDYVDGHEEVTVSSSSAYKAMAIYKKCIIELGIVPHRLAIIGVKSLDLICSRLTEDNKEEMLANAETQRFSELRKTYPVTVTKRALHSDFAVAFRYMHSALQNLLESKPELRHEILSVDSALEDLKEKVANGKP